MGRDKAAIVVGGETLLGRAVRVLSTMCDPVTVAGGQGAAPPVVRTIEDLSAGCGPLGGIAAALRYAGEAGRLWVMFLPVDMPLLPAWLLQELLAVWRGRAADGAWVCCAEAEGRVQPLVSLVHRDVLPVLEARLRAGEYRVWPALKAGAEALAAARGTAPGRAVTVTGPVAWGGRRADEEESAWRGSWFLNVNTPGDLGEIERILRDSSGVVPR